MTTNLPDAATPAKLRAAYARRLILARCPELTDADLAALAQPEADTLAVEVGEQILEVLEALETRMTELEFACGRIAEPAGL
jgi:hypothetical protein